LGALYITGPRYGCTVIALGLPPRTK
jgi:hypothetical protein